MPRVNGNSKQEIFKQISFGIWSCARHRHFFEAPSRSSNHWIINQQISTVFVTQGQPNFQISALHYEANQNKAKNCALATVSVFRSSLDRYRLGCSGKGGMLKVYTTYYNLGGDRFRSNRRTHHVFVWKNHLISCQSCWTKTHANQLRVQFLRSNSSKFLCWFCMSVSPRLCGADSPRWVKHHLVSNTRHFQEIFLA